MTRVLRALGRTVLLVLLLFAAVFLPFAIVVRWPSRREDAIVELLRGEDAPASPAPGLEVR